MCASSGNSALYLTVSLGHEDAARRLVMTGADVNFRHPGEDCDVLGKASSADDESGCEELMNDLLTAGASPNTRNGNDCRRRKTPLYVAAALGCEGIVSTLLARGADKDALDSLRNSPLNNTAAAVREMGVVNLLLVAGADVDIRDLEKLHGALQGR